MWSDIDGRIEAAMRREERAAQALLERMLDIVEDEGEVDIDLDVEDDPVEAYARYPFSFV